MSTQLCYRTLEIDREEDTVLVDVEYTYKEVVSIYTIYSRTEDLEPPEEDEIEIISLDVHAPHTEADVNRDLIMDLLYDMERYG